MSIREFDVLSDDVIKNFINQIGEDGQSYVSSMQRCPIFPIDNCSGLGKYVNTFDKPEINKIVRTYKLTEEQKLLLETRGLIEIEYYHYKNDSINSVLTTLVHEKYHSYRDLLVYDVLQEIDIIDSRYISANAKYDQVDDKRSWQYVDANQQILKGSIDDSKQTINKYKEIDEDELNDMLYADENKDSKMLYQYNIDETLIEIMALVSTKIHTKKCSIFEAIEELRDFCSKDETKDEKIVAMCQIILNHHDYELFKWMLFPLEYSNYDVHYDYFERYTKNDDSTLKNKFYENDDLKIK